MPIQSEDIKLLASSVMADTPDGGGALTGKLIVDGESNNIFPGTSEVDRAIGRVNIRALYGVAQTDDTDTLLGAHTIITDAPNDPLVHCLLMPAPQWGALRGQFREAIERYLVKGPRVPARLNGTHYKGSLQLGLYSFTPTTFPAGGDAIVLLNPDGREQYVRILRAALSTQMIAVVEGGSTLILQANVAVCDLGQELAFDFAGPPAERVIDITKFAQIFTTSVAAGSKFYGIKPLSAVAAPGDYSVLLQGGIYAPLVPAATIESPIIDVYPLTLRQSVARTARSPISLPPQAGTLAPGVVLTLPTAIEQGSLSITSGSTAFTDNSTGSLLQGATAVAAIDYAGKTVTFASASPTYGSNALGLTYKPATLAGVSTHSDSLTITTANQGRGFVYAVEPPPARGSVSVSYLAQGRWYELTDDGNGKLAGSDTSYGVGTVNYDTGSIAVTLGAIPDVGGFLIFLWGDSAVAKAYSGVVPDRLSAQLLGVQGGVDYSTLTLSWSRGATAYSATCNANGQLSGDAVGSIEGRYDQTANPVYSTRLSFAPTVFPDGPVDIAWSNKAGQQSEVTNNGGGNYTLAEVPVPRSIRFSVLTVPESGFVFPSIISVYDDGAGVLRTDSQGAPGAAVGTVNYTTRALTIAESVSMSVIELVIQKFASPGNNTLFYEARVTRNAHPVALVNAINAGLGYTKAGSTTAQTLTVTPTEWSLTLPLLQSLQLRPDGAALTIGDSAYFGAANVLRKSPNIFTGASTVAGSLISTGQINVTALPANGQNTVTLSNLAIDAASGLTVGQGVFRVTSAPLKTGVFQIQAGAQVGLGNDAGVISGGGWYGTVDFTRAVVRWRRSDAINYTYDSWQGTNPISAKALSYNAVFLQYLPLDAALIGLDTARLPLDGRVPIYRPGDLVVLHNTQTYTLPNPLVKGTTYNVGRQRLANIRIKTLTGATVSPLLYSANLDLGTLVFPAGSDLTGLVQPFAVEHRIEDMLVTTEADISGRIKFKSSITHTYPLGSFASGVLIATSDQGGGDVFGRVSNVFDQVTFTGEWSNERIGSDTLASYNTIDFPITTTNRGAVKERWALIFTSSTAFRIVGEKYGQVGVGNINTATAPVNTATGAPFFTVTPFGWGGGWSAGNVLRLNTDACGTAIGIVRTVLQGPDTLKSDQFTIAFRGDVNA